MCKLNEGQHQIYSEQVIRNSLVSEQLQLTLTVKQLKYIFETMLKMKTNFLKFRSFL